jgi:ssDNA-binding Zn-finger/Zn-ribbon topoisomerase 1
MELLGLVILVFVIVGMSSKPRKTSKTYPKITSPAPQKYAVQKNQSQTSQSAYLKQSRQPGVTGNANASPFVSNNSDALPDDSCSKCGKEWRRWDNTENGGYWYSCSGWPKCDNTRDKQKREKFCANGHRRTPSNTAYTAAGHRRCLICNPASTRRASDVQQSSGKSGIRVSPQSGRSRTRDLDKYCRNGHRRTDENTYVRLNGERECKVCRRNARK